MENPLTNLVLFHKFHKINVKLSGKIFLHITHLCFIPPEITTLSNSYPQNTRQYDVADVSLLGELLPHLGVLCDLENDL